MVHSSTYRYGYSVIASVLFILGFVAILALAVYVNQTNSRLHTAIFADALPAVTEGPKIISIAPTNVLIWIRTSSAFSRPPEVRVIPSMSSIPQKQAIFLPHNYQHNWDYSWQTLVTSLAPGTAYTIEIYANGQLLRLPSGGVTRFTTQPL